MNVNVMRYTVMLSVRFLIEGGGGGLGRRV